MGIAITKNQFLDIFGKFWAIIFRETLETKNGSH